MSTEVFLTLVLAGGIGASITLAGVAMSLVKVEPRLARVGLWIAWICGVLLCVWYGATNDMNRALRYGVGAIVAAVSTVALMAAFDWIKTREILENSGNQPHSNAAEPERPPPAFFKASDNSKITAKDMRILSDIRGMTFAKAEHGSLIEVNGLFLANSADLSFPVPNAELAHKSAADLKSAASALAIQFRAACDQRRQVTSKLRAEGKSSQYVNDYLKVNDETFKSNYQSLTLVLSGAILYRIPSGHPPSFNLTPKYLEGVPPTVRRGMRVLLMSGVTPEEGDVVAEFLDNIVARLPH